MKINLLISHALRYAGILAIAAVAVLVFQGQTVDENDPRYEQPTRESMSRFTPPNQTLPATITINDFDNFQLGTDYYEQHATSNPLNPLQMFFGVNASGSPQNGRYTNDGWLNWFLNNPLYQGGTCCDPWTAYTGSGV